MALCPQNPGLVGNASLVIQQPRLAGAVRQRPCVLTAAVQRGPVRRGRCQAAEGLLRAITKERYW